MKKVLIINHIFWPDKINTARHISELAVELTKKGWEISCLVGNRDYRTNLRITPSVEVWERINIRRIYLPALDSKNNFSRLFLSIYFLFSCIFRFKFILSHNIIIIGTNPPFIYLLVPFLKFVNSKVKVVLWSFDLYPDLIEANRGASSFLISCSKYLAARSYRKLDLLIDIGPCMNSRLRKYCDTISMLTITPWSFIEQANELKEDLETRKKLFNDFKLSILYTGTIGHAHEFKNFLLLARELRNRKASVGFCFAGFGKKFDYLKKLCNSDDYNINFSGFVDSNLELEKRVSSADIMMVSLKENFDGISVPSKFFTAIAAGKLILYSGSYSSSIGTWISEYKLGYVLTADNISDVADKLLFISENKRLLSEMKDKAMKIYFDKFSKEYNCDKFSVALHDLFSNNLISKS